MKRPDDGPNLPPEVLQKLNEIRNEDRRVRFRAGLLRGLAVLLTAMLLAMAIDWLAVLHDERWRWTLSLLALACAVVALVRGCLPPLFKSRSLASIAREVDRAHPSAEERFLTVAGFAQSGDAPEIRGSDAMLEKVAQQAAAMAGNISPGSVISRAGLLRAGKYLCGAAAALLLLFAVNFQQTKILLQRFWSPGSNITMTRLEAKPGDIVVGKGDDVNFEITATGRVPESADLFIRSANRTEAIPLQRAVPAGARFLYALNSVSDSFDYRVRAGDGETAWRRVTVLDRPKISQVRLRIVPPAYSHLPVVEQEALPRQVRALEGSRLEVSFQSDQPLAGMELKFADGKSRPIAESPDHSYHFNTTLTNTIAFTPVFTNLHHLDNLAKPTCEVLVYPDQPPTVTVLSPKNEITARPDDKVKIDFEARDDFGVASAELVVKVKSETNSTEVVMPIPLQNEAGAKKVRKQIELDLAKFNLKQDQELSYFVRVTDTKENPGLSTPDNSESPSQDSQAKPDNGNPASPTTPKSPNQKSAAGLAKADKTPAAQNPGQPKDGATNSPSLANADKPSASQNPGQPKDGAKSPPNSRPNVSAPQDNQIHLAMTPPPAKPREPSDGIQPPPNSMSKRVLDVAGQCCSCQPMKIVVDEWGRSFEGQMREKLEIAIDPVLKLLDGLLGKAQQLTDDTLAAGRSAEGLGQKQRPALEAARDDLRQADSAVSDLKKVSHDTPYAFISLQMDDMRDTYISPARKNLGDVAMESAALKDDITNLEQASFQIKRARERLADLTRTYETVKRDNKLADAMQRLAKMHQIFLEDSQAMLGASKPTLNPQERKVAEVSDEFADKLRKLLEEKKKILAELSKILADDPRLLRRFMAVQELEGTTLRDQMTLLAERQQSLAQQAAQWSASAGQNRAAFLDALLVSQSAEQSDVAALTSKLLENMVTWAPIDVPVDKEPIAGCRNLAAEAARLAAEASRLTTPETIGAGLASASNALDQLRQLQAALPGLDWIVQSKEKVGVFEANRLNDTAELITRQSGWIRKIEAVRAGDYARAAEVDQHRLMLDTITLGEKLDATAISLRSLSAEIKAKADELNGTMHGQILPEQSGAAEALARNTVPEAAGHQAQATNAFAVGERQFDDLLHLIIAKLDALPPPTEPCPNKTLEQLMAELNDEQKACEKLGVPCRPLNVQIASDWLRPSSCSNPGSAQGQTQAQAKAQAKAQAQAKAKAEAEAKALAQARAAQAKARDAKQKAEQTSDQAKELVQKQIEALPPIERVNPTKTGPKPAATSWNTLASRLGEELRQGRDNVPPEQYRQAIEQYFSAIAEKQAEAPAAAGH
jgi:hypothetical protein